VKSKLPPLCKHGLRICQQCIIVDDAARRMADIVNGLVAFQDWDQLRNTWLAIRLSDGGWDGNAYATREEAINHQLHETLCAYQWMGNMIGGAKPLDCAIFLKYHRDAYDAGMRLHEPEAPQLLMPSSAYDRITGRQPRARI
jgi:hypothetical protein